MFKCQANNISKYSILFHGVKRRSNEQHSLSLRINRHYIVDLPSDAEAVQCHCNTSAMTNHSFLVSSASRLQACIGNSWQHCGKCQDNTTWYILYNVLVAKTFVCIWQSKKGSFLQNNSHAMKSLTKLQPLYIVKGNKHIFIILERQNCSDKQFDVQTNSVQRAGKCCYIYQQCR